MAAAAAATTLITASIPGQLPDCQSILQVMQDVTDVAIVRLAVWCSGNALVSINAVALHRARLVLGWVTAFGQVNCLIT